LSFEEEEQAAAAAAAAAAAPPPPVDVNSFASVTVEDEVKSSRRIGIPMSSLLFVFKIDCEDDDAVLSPCVRFSRWRIPESS
jgi:hypothetical protein